MLYVFLNLVPSCLVLRPGVFETEPQDMYLPVLNLNVIYHVCHAKESKPARICSFSAPGRFAAKLYVCKFCGDGKRNKWTVNIKDWSQLCEMSVWFLSVFCFGSLAKAGCFGLGFVFVHWVFVCVFLVLLGFFVCVYLFDLIFCCFLVVLARDFCFGHLFC